MKVGDIVKFEKTGAIALIIEASAILKNDEITSGYVSLYISDGTLDNTIFHNGFTVMSYEMLNRTAGVINEIR